MLRRPRPRLRRRPGGAVAWLLALLLLQAQTLGLWHRVAHGPQAQVAAAGTASEGAAAEPFGHDADDEAGCRLFDAIGFVATAPADGVAPAQVPPAAPECRGPSVAMLPERPRFYEARAPPA